MDEIGSAARQKMRNGTLTRQHANAIDTTIGQLKAEMQLAKAEAKKAGGLPEPDIDLLRDGYTDLMLAGQELQQIEREIRTNDALELSIGGGYRYNETSTGITSASREDDAFANVTLGIRLGALSPLRAEAERAAETARQDALFEQYSGTIWKSEHAQHSIQGVIVDLKRTEQELALALAKTQDTIIALAGGESSETEFMSMQAKLRRIAISARITELRAAIKQLQKSERQLTSLSGEAN